MGILPCRLPCHDQSSHKFEKSDKHSFNSNNNNSNHQLHSESSVSSISSQPSLPSVPSLQISIQQQQHNLSRHQYDVVATLKAHSSYISALVLAGKFLYSASSDGTVGLWARDYVPNSLTTPYQSGNNLVVTTNSAVKSLVVCSDKLFTAHQDHKIRVWKIENDNDDNNSDNIYKCVATLPTFNDRFLTLFSAKNYVTVRRHKKRTWVHHNDAVSGLVVSDDGSLLYSASWDRTFKVWRVSDFKCLESVSNAHDDAVNAIALSSDGHVYTGSADKKIKAWFKPRGEKRHVLVATLEKHRSAVNALAVSGDGKVLYSGACDRSILVWEREYHGCGCGGVDCNSCSGGRQNGNYMVVVGALRGHNKAILCLAVVSDLVCSGSADCSVRVWRRGIDKSYACLAVLEGHRRPVKCLTLAFNGSCKSSENGGSDLGSSYLVYSGSLDCEIKVWKIWCS